MINKADNNTYPVYNNKDENIGYLFEGANDWQFRPRNKRPITHQVIIEIEVFLNELNKRKRAEFYNG